MITLVLSTVYDLRAVRAPSSTGWAMLHAVSHDSVHCNSDTSLYHPSTTRWSLLQSWLSTREMSTHVRIRYMARHHITVLPKWLVTVVWRYSGGEMHSFLYLHHIRRVVPARHEWRSVAARYRTFPLYSTDTGGAMW